MKWCRSIIWNGPQQFILTSCFGSSTFTCFLGGFHIFVLWASDRLYPVSSEKKIFKIFQPFAFNISLQKFILLFFSWSVRIFPILGTPYLKLFLFKILFALDLPILNWEARLRVVEFWGFERAVLTTFFFTVSDIVTFLPCPFWCSRILFFFKYSQYNDKLKFGYLGIFVDNRGLLTYILIQDQEHSSVVKRVRKRHF